MIPLLIIGLVWLSVTAMMCVLIGRAIRHADQEDEVRAERTWAAHTAGSRRVPRSGGPTQGTVWAPYPDHLLRTTGISRAGGRSPLLLRPLDWDDLPPDMAPRHD